jgi:hypothetical protein
MYCPKCRIENPEGKQFCRECGSRLALICFNCKSINIPSDKFCGDCGHNMRNEMAACTRRFQSRHGLVVAVSV